MSNAPAENQPHSAPPVRRRLGRLATVDMHPGSGGEVRKRSFWVGWGGIIITVTMGMVVVALLVGWVMLWVNRPGGANLALLVLGCVAFTLLLTMLATLHARLAAHWRLRQAEALFLTATSHGLRTPIGAIRTAAQALQHAKLEPEKAERLIRAIIGETRRLGLRVDNVLETGRLEVERQAFESAPIDLSALTETVCTDMETAFELRGGVVETDVADSVAVTGDKRAVRLLLENLLDNALKYSDGPPRIRVDLSIRDQFALLRVTDQGVGFEGGVNDSLFSRFARGDTARAGSGLGLALVRAIARGHGGDVHLHSEGLGKGAVAEAWLPLLDPT